MLVKVWYDVCNSLCWLNKFSFTHFFFILFIYNCLYYLCLDEFGGDTKDGDEFVDAEGGGWGDDDDDLELEVCAAENHVLTKKLYIT